MLPWSVTTDSPPLWIFPGTLGFHRFLRRSLCHSLSVICCSVQSFGLLRPLSVPLPVRVLPKFPGYSDLLIPCQLLPRSPLGGHEAISSHSCAKVNTQTRSSARLGLSPLHGTASQPLRLSRSESFLFLAESNNRAGSQPVVTSLVFLLVDFFTCRYIEKLQLLHRVC